MENDHDRAVSVLRKARIQALSNFTRSANNFDLLITDDAPPDLVVPAFQKVDKQWEKLEAAHDAFILEADIDIETDPQGVQYLDSPGTRHGGIVRVYATFIKKSTATEQTLKEQKDQLDQQREMDRRKQEIADEKAAADLKAQEEKQERFDSSKGEFEIALDAFKVFHLGVKDVVADASNQHKRQEWKKLSSDFDALKGKLVTLGSIDPRQDLKECQDKFLADAEQPFSALQKWFMSELKDSSEEPERSKSSSSSSISSTKKEPVQLPSFKGDEKSSPFLNYPFWRTQWETHIASYEDIYRAGLLWEKLDDVARSHLDGWQSDYKKSLSRLDAYYGDRMKVISCVMKEVNSQPVIEDGDYKSLLQYSHVLERNYTRLCKLACVC